MTNTRYGCTSNCVSPIVDRTRRREDFVRFRGKIVWMHSINPDSFRLDMTQPGTRRRHWKQGWNYVVCYISDQISTVTTQTWYLIFSSGKSHKVQVAIIHQSQIGSTNTKWPPDITWNITSNFLIEQLCHTQYAIHVFSGGPRHLVYRHSQETIPL